MKSFFKITKSKIILGLVVMILNSSMAFYALLAILCTESCPAPNIIQKFFSSTMLPFLVINLLTVFFEDIRLPEIVVIPLTFILSILILVFFWYTIACSLIKLHSLIQGK